MRDLTRTLLRVERAVHALRVASELAEAPAPAAALRHGIDGAIASSVRQPASPALDSAVRVGAALLDAAPAACAARAAWLFQDRGSRRPLVFTALAIGTPALGPAVAGFGGLPRPSLSSWHGAVDAASLAALAGMRMLPTRAAAAGALLSLAVRVRRGASASDAAAGALAGWIWARAAAVLIDPTREPGQPAAPVEMAAYRERRAER